MDSEEWIRVKEPLRKEEKMFINLKTGECLWEPPFNAKRIRESQEQWWELFDERTNRFYYYNSSTMETKWEKPSNGNRQDSLIIIPLHKLKIMKNQKCHNNNKEDKESQTVETLKVLIDNETQTEEQRHWQQQQQHSIYATLNDEGKNSLKDYLISEARYAGFSYDLYSSEENAEEWDADDEGGEEEDDEEDEEDEDESDDDDVYEDDDDVEEDVDDDDEEDVVVEERERVVDVKRLIEKIEESKPVPPRRDNSLKAAATTTKETSATTVAATATTCSESVMTTSTTTTTTSKTSTTATTKATAAATVATTTTSKSSKKEENEKDGDENLELFAKENIKRHIKKGGVNLLLKRKESMKGMLIWTKNSIKQPMIATLLSLGNEMKQDAIQCFKLIQTFCGDRENVEKKDSLLIAHELITKCVMKGVCLRDEVYVQLCRQTTSNPDDESCRKGLLLMAMCLFYFGPSSKFAPYLSSFLAKHKLRESWAQIRVAQNKLEKRINLMKNGSTNYGGKHGEHLIEMSGFTKKPSSNLKELQMIVDAIECDQLGWFGESLQSTVNKQLDKQRKLPWIQVELSEIILKLSGLESEGIFRIGPDFEEMSSVRLKIDCNQQNQIEFSADDDVNIYASLLKQWFRELSSPLIPVELYEDCLKLCESPEESTQLVLNYLPLINKLSLGYLIRFLQVFAAQKNVHKTKMDENNLSMVWSPNILRSPPLSSSSATSTSLFENTRKEMLFIKTLIKHLNTSFIQGIV